MIEEFILDMKYLFDNVPLEKTINIVETAILITPKNLKILHSKGKDDVIIPVKYSDMERIMCVYAICANGSKYLMQFITKCEADKVLNTQIGDVRPHLNTFSIKGWIDSNTIYECLNYIRSQFIY